MFQRALIAFLALTLALFFLGGLTLWAIVTFVPSLDFLAIFFIAILFGLQIGVYSSTLERHVRAWINEVDPDQDT